MQVTHVQVHEGKAERIIKWIVVLGIILIAFLTWQGLTREQPKNEEAQQQAASVPQNAKSGTYSYNGESYSYTFLSKPSDATQAAVFQPFLPRNDAAVMGAIRTLINATYGTDAAGNSTPQLVELDGKNYIKLTGSKSDYYALLVKETTGEVNSISYFRR